MKAKHAVGDVVTARDEGRGIRWQEAVIREVHYVETWVEYKVSFRLKSGRWAKRLDWAEVQREEARR